MFIRKREKVLLKEGLQADMLGINNVMVTLSIMLDKNYLPLLA